MSLKCLARKPAAVELKSSGGFTLLELLVNLAIIGILIAVAIPVYNAFRDKAKTAGAKSDLHTIRLTVEQLANDTEKWPGPSDVGKVSSREVWDLNSDDAGLVQAGKKFSNWKGPYLNSIPKDPWGSDYFFDGDYAIGGTKYAIVGSFGPNRCCQNKADSDDIILKLTE